MADRYELLKVIGQELSSYVETADGLLYGPAIEERSYGRMRVTRVDNKQTLGRESSKAVLARRGTKKALDVMICIERWTYPTSV